MKIDEIIRSNRKTFSIEVKPDGRLIVRAPKQASRAQIQTIVEGKAGWIEKSRARLARRFPTARPKTFTPGERFWYLGEQYPLQLTNRQRPPLDLEGAFILSRAAQNRAKDVFVDWYREETRQITARMIDTYTKRYGFNVNRVRITSARTRWGSCSGKSNLNFTYRLCMAPLPVIDYVVVHELVHLEVYNHSKAFWRAVAEIKGDYQKDREWLKQNGPLLTID